MKSIIKKILYIINKKEKKYFIYLTFAILLFVLLEGVGLGLLIPIMKLFLNPELIEKSEFLAYFSNIFQTKTPQEFLIIVSIATSILFLVKSVYGTAVSYLQQFYLAKINQRITSKIFHSLLVKDYEFHLMTNSAELFKNVMVDVSNFIGGYLQNSIQFIINGTLILTIVSVLAIAYPYVTIIGFLSIAILVFIVYKFTRIKIKTASEGRDKYNRLEFKSLKEGLGTVKEIQIFNVADIFVEKLSHARLSYLKNFLNFTFFGSFPAKFVEILVFISAMGIIIFSISNNIPAGEVVPIMIIFAIAASRLLPLLISFVDFINHFHFFGNSLDIIYDRIESSNYDLAHNDLLIEKVTLPERCQNIILKNVNFKYNSSDNEIFNNFNIEIPVYKMVAFVGESGSGKSTLVNLIISLLKPSSGHLYYGENEINHSNIVDYRHRIGYVSQHIELLDDSIAGNIAFGLKQEEIDFDRVKETIKMAQLEDFVNQLPEGLDTFVGESGVRISGGQKQRIGIARALYHNPKILILDEATSALDSFTEENIMNTIISFKGKLTIILVAHRLSTVKKADTIYVMDKGEITDQGTFDDLKEKSASFRKIASQQIH